MEDLPLALAQTLPLDPQSFFVWGPLGAAVGGLLWYVGVLHTKLDKAQERYDTREKEHRVEIAAERALNEKLQSARLEDHKVLISLTNSSNVMLEGVRDELSAIRRRN